MSPGTPSASPPDPPQPDDLQPDNLQPDNLQPDNLQPDELPPDISALVRERYGIELRSGVRETGGTDEHSTVWRAHDADGHAYALKLSHGSLTPGLVAAAQPSLAGVAGISAPLATTRSGSLWLSLPGAQLAIFPWVDGRGGTDRQLTAESWRRFGRLMAALHRVSTVVDLGAPIPEETFRPPAAARVRALGRRVEILAQVAVEPAGGGDLDEISQEVVRTWLEARDSVARVIELAAALSLVLSERSSPYVLTHGDCHLFNVVVGADEQVWLVDWVDAALAPPERDLIFFIGGIFADAQLSPAEQQWFFEGYGSVDIDQERLAYYRCVRALEDIEWAARALDLHRPDDERTQALGFFREVLSPHGMVEQALTTLER